METSADSGSSWTTTTSDHLFEVYGEVEDNDAPTYSVLGQSGSTGGASASFYLYANDNYALGSYVFSYKIGEGSYTNLTGTSFASTLAGANCQELYNSKTQRFISSISLAI